VWPNREALLACIGPGESAEKVVRSCARLAAQLELPWHAVHVETPVSEQWPQARRQPAVQALKLAQELGAVTAMVSAPEVAGALVRHAREHNLARLVLGRSQRHWPWHRSLAERIFAQADDLDLLQVALPQARARAEHIGRPGRSEMPGQPVWRGYLAALLACGLTALLATPLIAVFELSNIVMLFLLVVVGVALAFGRGPAVLAAFVGVGMFDFFFVPPRFSFAVSDVQYLLTFVVMLLVALVVGQLTAGLRVQALAATRREHRVRSLYEMSRDLSAALLPEQVADIGARFLRAEFGARSALLVANASDHLEPVQGSDSAEPLAVELGLAQWAFDRGEAAGLGTNTLAASDSLVLPLRAPMRLRGVLAVRPTDRRLIDPQQRQLLDTCASLLAISLERIHYIEVAQSTTLQMESERLRNSLLSAISHDLRTPLASLVGLADTLAMTRPAPSAQQLEISLAIRLSALRMNALVNNLLDMARLESGAVQLNLQWQPMEEVVGSALAACAPALAGRPLSVQLGDELPLVQLDTVLIERVLVNLLENAAKYTPAGSPIGISAELNDEQVLLHIDDHGPGLPAGREEAIFQKFERGRKESATPGVGLGLAICKAILQAHHGDIAGSSRAVGGARFTLSLPRGEPPQDDGSTDLPLPEAVAAAGDPP
jgi:two-component system sensor histidine kinase KdpD